MKRTLVAAVTIALVALVAMPAQAKGISYAHFTGPGLPSSGVTIRGASYDDLWQLGLTEPKSDSSSDFGVSKKDLGPAYRAEYRMDYAPSVTLRQVIYPYAESGPMTFTPSGQHIGQDYESFRGGWFAAPSDLLTFLAAHGFPEKAGTAAAEKKVAAATVAKESGGSSLAWLWTVIGLAVVGSLVALNVRLRRRRQP